MRLDRAFFARPSSQVAPDLLGCVLHTRFSDGETSGSIVETEAYAGPEDPASHAARLSAGRRRMAGSPGVAYVYRSYGIHAMFNIVCGAVGEAGAVLIRAAAPVDGAAIMATRRGNRLEKAPAAGPGRLCQAFGIGLEHDGIDLVENDLIWLTGGESPAAIFVSGRIGISRAKDTLWRFFDPASPYVSAHKRGIAYGAGGSMLDDEQAARRTTG